MGSFFMAMEDKTNGKLKTTEEILREAERNELDLLARLMEAPGREGYVNNPSDGAYIRSLSVKGLVVKIGKDSGKQRWQINNEKFRLKERELLKDLLRI